MHTGRRHTDKIPALRMTLMDDPENSAHGAPRQGGLDNVIKDFVTQRSLQSLLHNLEMSSEGCKVEFLEKFLNHTGIADFHGYGGLRVGWKVYLQTLRKAAPFDVVQRKKLGRRGSAGNPYIQDEFVEWTIHVNPIEMADSMFEMREQIASEWQADLQLIASENSELFRHHKEMILNDKDEQLQIPHPLIHGNDKDTPLRKANYDLLEKYVTHVAVERVIFELGRQRANVHTHEWLRTYMMKKGQKFNGDHGRNVGREFLAELLNAPPKFIKKNKDAEDENVAIIDPMDIAAKIMVERQNIAEKWVETLAEVEEDHLKLHRQHMQDCLDLNAVSGLEFD